MTILQMLLIIMIIAAVVAVEAEDLFTSVASVGAVGFALALSFLILKSPDLAVILLFVELAVLLMVIRNTGNRSAIVRGRGTALTEVLGAVIVIAFLGLSFAALGELPRFGHAIEGAKDIFSSGAVRMTGAVNIVSAVALDFRVFDALAGFSVLFLAACGVSFIFRRKTRRPG